MGNMKNEVRRNQDNEMKSPDDQKKYRIVRTKAKDKKYGASYYWGFALRVLYRIILIIVTLALIVVFGAYKSIDTIAHGPSPRFRDMLVQMAMESSAAKWVPRLVLSEAEVDEIMNKRDEAVVEEVDVPVINGGDVTGPVITPEQHGGETLPPPDISDGIEYYSESTGTFRAYIMIVHDPSKVFVGISSNDFPNATRGQRIYDAAKKYGAIAAINGGEFRDTGGQGLGERPIGLTYSQGKCVWDDGTKRTFFGIDKNNKLIVTEGMTKKKADELGIRDGVSFQTNNVLIYTENGSTYRVNKDDSLSKAQRTAVGQRADGKFIFIVTDGRSASSLGATYDDITDMMLKYGAINAGMLDGGSSAMMYYANYISKFNVDVNTLDEFQQLGLVNKYKAFTRPRPLPTFFMVMPK